MGRMSNIKGAGYERYLAKKIGEKLGIQLDRTPGSGNLDIKGDLRSHEDTELKGPLSGWTIEAKKQEKPRIWNWIKQSREEAKGKKWLLIFSKNHEKDYATVELDFFLGLLKDSYILKQEIFNELK